MRITADTDLLVRMIVRDDPAQAEQAEALLSAAELVAIPVPVLCELAWVLRRGYRRSPEAVADTIAELAEVGSVVTHLPSVEAGLAVLRAGGDFADGAIAHQGTALGGAMFASFDRRAIALLRQGGATAAEPAELLAPRRD